MTIINSYFTNMSSNSIVYLSVNKLELQILFQKINFKIL